MRKIGRERETERGRKIGEGGGKGGEKRTSEKVTGRKGKKMKTGRDAFNEKKKNEDKMETNGERRKS